MYAKIKEHFPNSLKHFPFFQATCTHTNQITWNSTKSCFLYTPSLKKKLNNNNLINNFI